MSFTPSKLFLGSDRRRAAFNRDRLIALGRTLLWTAPLTVLIWIYAEREQVVYPNSPNVNNVQVVIRSSKRFVEPAGPAQPTVNLKISGPQEAIDSVRNKLTRDIPHELEIDVGDSLPVAGRQPVQIVQRIQDYQVFRQAGVTVEESQPAELLVNVDEYATRSLPIEAPPEWVNLAAKPTFSPATVTVTGPRAAVDAPGLRAQATVADFADVKPGGPTVLPGQVVVRGGEKLQVSPRQTSVTLTVRDPNERYTITDGIPIYISGPANFVDENRVLFNDPDASISNIEVIGPKEAIDAIRNKSAFVKATLELKPEDAGRAGSSRLRYDLPEGVRESDATRNRTVDFKVVKR